jgi:monofunctional biosynthetic peptidoglycan transglycosylase
MSNLIKALIGCAMLATSLGVNAASDKADNAIEFSQKSELENWVIVNDTVMGGRSRAGLGLQDNYLVFAGDLSLQNNGGFASTRRIYAPIEWSAKQAIEITIKGDGRSYQFRLRTNRNMDGVAYVAEFDTKKGEDQTLTFQLNDFMPLWRGRYVRNAPELQFDNVSQIGFMLADKTPGEFVLQVQKVRQLPEFI